MVKIPNKYTGKVICEGETEREAAEKHRANLTGADLTRADLTGANLAGADLTRADLTGANLAGAYLTGADFAGAYLTRANLTGANLAGAYLTIADLTEADLTGANLTGANLAGAKHLFFPRLPSLSLLSSFHHGEFPDELTLELMRRDAWAHPHPERFDAWAKGGPCPYENEDRFWLFEVKRNLWEPGPPEMRDSDLIIALCLAHGWKIKGYLPV